MLCYMGSHNYPRNNIKMKEQEEEQKIEPLPPDNNALKIGDLMLSSPTASIDHLCSLSVWLLEQEEIKNYLNLTKSKKVNGNYIA